MKKHNRRRMRPDSQEIRNELSLLREEKKRRKNIHFVLIVTLSAIAVIVLLTNIWFPMFRVVGSSMEPQLAADDIILCIDSESLVERGNIIAFYNNENVLLKRVVAVGGDEVVLDEQGLLIVNGEIQEEAYVKEASLEPCDVTFPVIVPENTYFVLGDQRTTSMDSRSSAIGMIGQERVIGKALLRIWPVYRIDLL